MELPFTTSLACAPMQSDGPSAAESHLAVAPDAPSVVDIEAAWDAIGDTALTRELDRERETMVPWLPRFDVSGKLVGEAAGACPWQGLCDTDRAELFQAAMERVPPVHQMLARLTLRDEPAVEAFVRTRRCRLAVHQAIQAILHLARDTLNRRSSISP